MEKMTFNNLKSYTYDANHKGAHYTFDGAHFMNSGEFNETQLKHCLGYEAKKDANTPFDKGSDIEELNMSVKSAKASLTSVQLGDSFDEILCNYFKRVASTKWAWVVMINDELVAYIMDKMEFEKFTRTFGSYNSYKGRNCIRYKTSSATMIKWLETL